jgi:CTP:molybdopterin cytidylyltransferase MocA
MRAVCAVLAAGASRRLGVPKQLLELADGVSLVRNAAQSACTSQAERSAVVVGAHASEVSESIAGLPVDLVESEDPGEGVAASIRAAPAWGSGRPAAWRTPCHSYDRAAADSFRRLQVRYSGPRDPNVR